MAFDLIGAKLRLGITDASKDAQLLVGLNTALALAENYCDRRFMYKRETGAFYDADSMSLMVDRYPIDTVTSITSKSTGAAISSNSYKVHHWAGIIRFHGAQFFDEIDIDYTGGFNPFPADLELALWMIFDAIWPTLSGTGGTATVAAGTIESVSIPDVGTVKFATGAAAASSASGGGSSSLIPSVCQALLDKYRNAAPIGVS